MTQFQELVANPNISDILRKDSPQKVAVKGLQQILFELGFQEELQWSKWGADGGYGGATTAAILAFAQKNNLETDGTSVSPELAEKMAYLYNNLPDLRALQALLNAGQTADRLRRGSGSKQNIQALQRLLNTLGYGEQLNWDRWGADGGYGDSTVAAVIAFAEKEGADNDGNSVSADIASSILKKFTPSLGKDWANNLASKKRKKTSLKPVKNRTRLSQYAKVFPSAARGLSAIQQELNQYDFEASSHLIPKDNRVLNCQHVTRKNRDASYYYHDELVKERIVLHFTAGQIAGDFGALTLKGNKVSTAFLLGRDGTIYKLFPNTKFWSYHIGRGAIGGNTRMSQRSIGIEVSNWGPLRDDGKGGLVTWDHGYWFCNLDETDAYIKIDEPFRGASYFAAITDQQYDSLISLLRYLVQEFDIPANFLEAGRRDQLFRNNQEAIDFKGVCCHTNFRPTGKWDFAEAAFDWERIIAGVTADDYVPAYGTRSLDGPAPITEAEMTEAMHEMHKGKQDCTIYGEDGPDVDI